MVEIISLACSIFSYIDEKENNNTNNIKDKQSKESEEYNNSKVIKMIQVKINEF